MTGKEKCKYLKELRATIASYHNIEGFEYKECDFEGECKGTCPACDAEAEKLYEILQEKGRTMEIQMLKDTTKVAYYEAPPIDPFLMGDFGDDLGGEIDIPRPELDDIETEKELSGKVMPENYKKPSRNFSEGKLRGVIRPNNDQYRIDTPMKKPRGLLNLFRKDKK